MTTENNLTELSEFDQALLAELVAGGANMDALVAYLKKDFVCDYSTLPALMANPAVKAAAGNLIEKAAASTYGRRLMAKMYLNADTLETGRTNFWLAGPASTAQYAAASKQMAFSHKEGDAEDLFSDQLMNVFTVRTAGAYRLGFSGLLAGFSNATTGTQLTAASTTSHRFTTDAGVTGMPVDVILKITSGANNYYMTLATLMLYPTDFSLFRTRSIAGDTMLRLLAGSQISVHLQRRGKQGNYLTLANSTSAAEAVGFNKSTTSLPGMAVPTRDGYNCLEVTRLT